jgi:hypothetical protein
MMTIMTKSMAVAKCRAILDELVDAEIAARRYKPSDKRFVRFAMDRWKAFQITRIEQWVDDVARRC